VSGLHAFDGSRESGRDRNLIGALLKAHSLLSLFSHRRPERSTMELAEESGYPRPTVHRILSTMLDVGWVSKTEAGLWTLGPSLFRFGSLAADSFDIRRSARPYLAALASRTGDSSYLFVTHGERVLCLDRILGPGSVKVSMVEVGQTLPSRRGAAPRVLLAFDPVWEGQQDAAEDAELMAELDLIRKRGYALNLEELAAGICAVSAPVFDQSGSAVAAMSLGGLRERFSDERLPEICQQVVATAQQVSRNLGYKGEWPW
jgi:DNA-binding IclR family transcriptional regulator